MAVAARVAFAAVLLVVAACAAPEFPKNRPSDDGFRAEDAAVYNAVLPQYPISANVLGKDIRLLAYTDIRKDPIQPQADRWYEPSGGKLPPMVVSHAILRDFTNRNQRHVSLSDYQPRDLKLSRTNEPDLPLLSLTLPGYSPDCDSAIVEISIFTSGLSGGGELVYLRKVSGQWRVIAKQQRWIS